MKNDRDEKSVIDWKVLRRNKNEMPLENLDEILESKKKDDIMGNLIKFV